MTTWSIGEAAAKCGLSQHTLRWYERIGLLAKIERGGDGRRRFSEGDLEWLSLITKLRATGNGRVRSGRCAGRRSTTTHSFRPTARPTTPQPAVRAVVTVPNSS